MDRNVATLKRWFEEVWNQGRLKAIEEMASPDVIAHGQAQHTVDVGLKEFREFARGIRAGFPDIHVTIEQTLSDGDFAVARWSATMTHTGPFLGIAPSGRKATVTGTTIARFADGKVIEGWDNWDQLGLLVQIGVVSPAEFEAVKGPVQAKAS